MKFDGNYGDYVELHTGKEIYEGVMLPSPENGVVLLKLDSGYNIGFNKKELVDFKVVRKVEREKVDVEIPYDENKKNVAMVILGGTISARLNPGKGGVDYVEDSGDLFKCYPEVFDKVNVSRVEIPFVKGSEDMDYKDWQKVSKVVCDLVNDKNIDGVVVTQGTDSLHFTSAALSFFLRDLGKPVVVTFSQRSIDRGSSDANLNLVCSCNLAVSDFSGVAVVGHASSSDDCCYAMAGTKVRKMHSSKRDAFKSVNREPFFKIFKDRIEKVSDYIPRNEKRRCIVDSKFEEKVALLKFYPGQSPDILDYYLENGYRGVVVEMLGLGQVATSKARLSWTRKIKEVQGKGLVVCASAQTVYGRLNPLVYVTGRELLSSGVIYLEDMLSETAFVKLGWVLGHKDWDVKEKMLESFSWEINDRIVD